jgi:ATP-dependent RNA helicase DeaD
MVLVAEQQNCSRYSISYKTGYWANSPFVDLMTLENQLSLDDAVSSFAPTYETAPTVEESGPPASSPDAGLFQVVPAALRSALEGRGFKELTPVQKAVMAPEAEGRDLQISSQTGSGKTVALGFVLAPALSAERVGRGPQALIIVPTRELAAQVCEELRWLFQDLKDTSVISVTGGTPVYRDRQTLARNPRVLVGTPGRLLDHIKSGTLQLGGVRELVLDEADQMLDMGFREDLEAILDATEEPRRTHMMSATFPDAALRLAKRYQHNPFSVEGTRLGEANANITHEGYLVRHGERYDALVHLLLQAEGERILVFVERRLEALEVAERLADDGFAAQPLSGELVQAQRDRTLAAFRSGRATVLVATDVAARGLDVPDVGLVIHSTPPINSEIYTHRSGRTGRAGKQGRSAVFAPPKHKRKVGRLLAEAGVEFRWCPTVEIGEVRAQLVARAQENLETDLDEALLKGSSKEQVAQARGLLKGRDPVAVVATLLAQRHPAPQPKQAPSHSGSTYEKPAYKQSGSHKSNGFGKSDFHAGSESPFKSAPTQRFQRSAPTAGGRFAVGRSVRFFISYGSNQGANPSRVLAAVCRRGEVEGGMIGSIAVHPNACTFDVQEEVAMHFERCAGRRDPRDSKVVIRRDRSPGQAPRGARRGRGGYRRR